MRRLALFLVLFALGLAVLLWITRSSGVEAPAVATPQSESGAPERFTKLPGENQQGGAGLHLDGALTIQKRTGVGDTRKTEYTLTATDVDFLEGDDYDFHDLVLKLFDPATGHERAQLRSPLTRMRLPIGADGRPVLDENEHVRFSNVELVLEEGAPITPLTLRMPLLEWTPSNNELRSSDRVQITGEGVTAEGSGLEASAQRENLRLLRDGSIELQLEDGARANLKATGGGPFELKRIEPPDPGSDPAHPPSAIQVHVAEGALLELTAADGSKSFDVRARDLVLRGVQTRSGAKVFRLLSADAEGAVVAHSRGDSFEAEVAHWRFDQEGRLLHADLERSVLLKRAMGEFRAQTAGFDFNPNGKLRRAELTGEPNGVVELENYIPKNTPEFLGSRAHISGAGPLVLTSETGTHVEIAGPARLEVPETGFVIDAATRLSGNTDAGADTGSMLAEGDARARWRTSELRAPKIDLRYALRTDRGNVLGLLTDGASRATLAMPQGEPLDLRADGGLEARWISGHLTFPLSRNVELERKGEEAFQAGALVVRDFDPAAQSFTAEGDVHFSDARSKASADRVVSTGPTERRFFGTARAPAHWDSFDRSSGAAQASAQAVEIHVHEAKMEALGSVRAELEARDAHERLECEELQLERVPEPGVELANSRSFHALALRGVHAHSESALRTIALECDELELDGRLKSEAKEPAPAEVETGKLHARGAVHLEWTEAGNLSGEGQEFELDAQGHGKLSAVQGGRVRAIGRLPGRAQLYQLEADQLEFDEQHLEARQVVLVPLQTPGAKAEAKPDANDEVQLQELSTAHLRAERDSLVLEGQAHVQGRMRSGERWSIDSDSLRFEGSPQPRANSADVLSQARAEGAVHVRFGEELELFGDRLTGSPKKLRVEGRPATLNLSDLVWEASWIEYQPDNMMLATDRGTLRARDQHDKDAWSVEYESLQPFDQEDATILVLGNPVFHQQRREMRANWALFWVDREEWRRNTAGVMRKRMGAEPLHVLAPEPLKDAHPATDLRQRFATLRDDPLARILSEVYLEGEVEVNEKDLKDPTKSLRRARAKAFYLDLRQGVGWLQEADVVLDLPFHTRGLPQALRAKASWMRVQSDLSLSADDAVITSCEYDEPHYMIETQHLRITPAGEGEKKKGWNFVARGNAMRFGKGGLSIPLPTIDTPTDERGNPYFISDLVAGNSAKFGASVRATVNLALGGLGLGIGRLFGGALRLPTTDLDGHWSLDLGILGTRGILLGTGLEFSIPKLLRLRLDYSVVTDTGEDRGLIRVPEDDRSLLRQWIRMRGRRFFSPTEWLDLAFSLQSDPAVQSEFFEHDFFAYEQKDNYVHWRRAEGLTYFSASAKVLLEDRTDVEELPSASWYLGRVPIGTLGQLQLLYTGQASAGYLRRHDGDPAYYAPFPDGTGDHDVARVDLQQRVEAPFEAGFAHARATPFVGARATAWSSSLEGDASATRGVVTAGMDLSTTWWRRYHGGTLSTLTPRVSLHGDVVDEQGGPPPVPIDSIEDNQSGTFVDFGMRARWWHPVSKEVLDLDLNASHAWSVDGEADGWRDLTLLGSFLTLVGSVPVGMTQDLRYSPQDQKTEYSRSLLGFRPMQKWGVELGFHYGRDAGGNELFEAASFTTRYIATPKWEFDLSQTIALDQDQGLDNQFILRRLGHDFVMEMGVGYRAGEGTSFGLKLTPNISFRRSGLGLIDAWLGPND